MKPASGSTTGSAFDAVIIGAGPAGSTAAILLARAGWKVALVEKQAFPRRKVCGECIAASNLPLLDALGVGAAFDTAAGPALTEVHLHHGRTGISALLPAADNRRHRWGRALGRETLDTMLRDQACSAGAELLQPWSLQALQGGPGDWRCTVREVGQGTSRWLRTPVCIDAHGSWESLHGAVPQDRVALGPSSLLAFKASFTGAALREGGIHVLALDGGYGGMVQGDRQITTLACCIRRDRLDAIRRAAPGVSAGDAVQAWLSLQCAAVHRALLGATRQGPWLASGPIRPGSRVLSADGSFRIGNAAGEAHPILGEGISMALQSAALLCSHLLPAGRHDGPSAQSRQQALQRQYATHWHNTFGPRLRVAAAFAHAASRPWSTTLLVALLRAWPALLTAGARWGGKVDAPAIATPGNR